jgi:hypothetical protein
MNRERWLWVVFVLIVHAVSIGVIGGATLDTQRELASVMRQIADLNAEARARAQVDEWVAHAKREHAFAPDRPCEFPAMHSKDGPE